MRESWRPLAERPAADILETLVDLFKLIRLMHFQARGETFVICDRGSITKSGVVPIYVERELPLREAGELIASLLAGFPAGHEWRVRLVLCPVRERNRAGIHLLLMAPPRKGRPRSEPVWMRASTADTRGKPAPARAKAENAPVKRSRPGKHKPAQAGQAAHATMGTGAPA